MSELEHVFLAQVYKLCRGFNVYAHHCNDATRCHGKGWPDLVLVGKHGALFREVKNSPVDTLRPEQTTVLYLLRASGLDAAVWRPEDLHSGAVAKQIAEIS